MEYLSSTFLAFLLSCVGVFVFREPQSLDCGPLVSCLIFQTALAILLINLCLYPKSLRRLPGAERWFYELLLSLLIFEVFMHDFWFPLESSLLRLLPYLADYDEVFENWTGSSNAIIFFLFDIFRWEGTGVVASYLLSIEFLLAILHATRIIDLTLLKCSYRKFVCYMARKVKEIKCEIDKVSRIEAMRKRKACRACCNDNCCYRFGGDPSSLNDSSDQEFENEPFVRIPFACKCYKSSST